MLISVLGLSLVNGQTDEVCWALALAGCRLVIPQQVSSFTLWHTVVSTVRTELLYILYYGKNKNKL